MKPLPLRPDEVDLALSTEPGQTFMIARIMEPQPNERCDYRYINAHNEAVFRNRAGFEFIKSPFGPVGQELYGQEEWRLFGWMDDAPVIAGQHPRGLRLTVEYQPETDENETGRSYYPDSKDYNRVRSLVQCYEDECRTREASIMPQWASRLPLINRGTTAKRVQDVTEEEAEIMGYKTKGAVSAKGDAWIKFGDKWIWVAQLEVTNK